MNGGVPIPNLAAMDADDCDDADADDDDDDDEEDDGRVDEKLRFCELCL
jgi:hypothetical protein